MNVNQTHMEQIAVLLEAAAMGVTITDPNDKRLPIAVAMATEQLLTKQGEAFVPAERGIVWLEMILQTPYPQKQWIDPRFSSGAAQAPSAPSPAMVAPSVAPAAPARPPVAPAAEVPPGFIAVPDGNTTRPVEHLPTGKEFIMVLRRNGKMQGLYAASVNWKVTGKKDDILAFQIGEEPESARKAHIGNSNRSKPA